MCNWEKKTNKIINKIVIKFKFKQISERERSKFGQIKQIEQIENIGKIYTPGLKWSRGNTMISKVH